MTLFIYQNDKLYADMRKIVNFPNAEIIKPSIETKVCVTPYCIVAMGGIPFPENDYLDTITKLEAVVEMREILLERYKKKPSKIYREFINFEKILLTAVESLVALTKYDGHTFIAMTAKHVWCKTGNPGDPIRRYENEGNCAAGAGDEFAKILLTNGIDPEKIYPAIRKVGIPVGENFQVFKRSQINTKLKPPVRSRDLWIDVAHGMINSEGSDKYVELIQDLMFFIGVISIPPGKRLRKFSEKNLKSVEHFIHDWNTKKTFKKDETYLKIAPVVEEQIKDFKCA